LISRHSHAGSGVQMFMLDKTATTGTGRAAGTGEGNRRRNGLKRLVLILALSALFTAAVPFAYSFENAGGPVRAAVTAGKKKTPATKQKRSRRYPARIDISLEEAEARGVFNVMRHFGEEVCIREIPLFLALHRCFYADQRLLHGTRLVLERKTIVRLLQKAARIKESAELSASSTAKIDSLVLYRKKENRRNKKLCNFIAYVEPGSYLIPKTDARIALPQKVAGSILYEPKKGSMIVYIHTGGIKLELPSYSKTLSLGMIGDMDIGMAELEYGRDGWTARLLYMKENKAKDIKGWSFNVTECRKIRPYSR
jgi:hypothetical protein